MIKLLICVRWGFCIAAIAKFLKGEHQANGTIRF